VAGGETLLNKTIVSPSLTGAPYNLGSYRSAIITPAALDIDCSAGNYFTKSVSSNSTFTFSNAPASRAYGFMLRVSITGSVALTWPASVKWPSGSTPSPASGTTNLFVFMTDDGGTTWRGAALLNYAG